MIGGTKPLHMVDGRAMLGALLEARSARRDLAVYYGTASFLVAFVTIAGPATGWALAFNCALLAYGMWSCWHSAARARQLTAVINALADRLAHRIVYGEDEQ